MKKIIYLMCLVTSLSLVFNQNKTCCKNKDGQVKTSCKYKQNQNGTTIEPSKLSITESNIALICPNAQKCSKNTANNQKWWKFWQKQGVKSCCNIKI